MQDIVKQIVDMDRKAREITAAVEQDRLNSEKEIAQKRVELRAEYLAKAREAIPSSESQERAAAEKEWEIVAKKHADLSRELDELYSNAYVYTLPSDLEGMPLSLLEAMSYGNCCLVSDIEECASVVEDKALVFKKADVNDLREKLQTVCEKEDVVQKRKEEAADFICEKYNWDDVVRRTLKLYRR